MRISHYHIHASRTDSLNEVFLSSSGGFFPCDIVRGTRESQFGAWYFPLVLKEDEREEQKQDKTRGCKKQKRETLVSSARAPRSFVLDFRGGRAGGILSSYIAPSLREVRSAR